MLFILHTPLIISLSSSPLPTIPPPLPFFPVSSVLTCGLYPFLWLWHLPVNLSQSPQVSVQLHTYRMCCFAWTYIIIFLYLRSGQPLMLSESYDWEIRAVNTLAVATWMWFSGPRWSISVSVVWQRVPPAPHSNTGLRKMVSCGGLRPRPFPSLPSLWGPVGPRYFPSLIDSRDGLLAGGAVLVCKCVRRL